MFWALAFPVIFTVVFGLFDFTASPEVRFAVVADGETPVSEALLTGRRRTESFTVHRGQDFEAARARLQDGEVEVVLSVSESSAEGRATVEAVYDESNAAVNQFALRAVERLVNGLNLRLAGVISPPVTMRAEGVAGKTVKYYDFLLPRLVAMGVMNFSITGMSVAIAQYREKGS